MKRTATWSSILTLLALSAVAAYAGPGVQVVQSSASIDILGVNGGATLTVAGDDFHSTQTFRSGQTPSISLYADGQRLAPGTYTWELRIHGEAPTDRTKRVPTLVETGAFTIQGDGTLADSGALEGGLSTKDQQILDDLIVDGSACVGQDCANGESFGFDTLRIKENNLRIHADDTSNSASFPQNDWRLVFNDSSNGGQNRFSVEDATAGYAAMTIENGAGANALYVDAGGEIGFGTNSPVVDLHVKSGNTPTLRLEQDGSSGFTAQTWDVAGNEAGFFVRDATNGSTLPFRIIPSAPQNSLVIGSNGNIGINAGTSPSQKLTVTGGSARVLISGTDGNSRLIVTEGTNGANSARTMAFLENNGPTLITMDDSSLVNDWQLGTNSSDSFVIRTAGGADEFELTNGGDLNTTGLVNGASSRASKENFLDVDPAEVLSRVTELPIQTWNYIHQDDGKRHLTPMAEDFWAAFHLGSSDKMIAPADMAGVSLAAIQALAAQNQELVSTIEALQARLAALESAQD